MTHQRIHKSSSWNPPVQANSSAFAPRPFAAQAQQNAPAPPVREDSAQEAIDQDKFEVFGLQLKDRDGTSTPVEQERLGVLQAKTADFSTPSVSRAARFGHNFANIGIHAPGKPAPVQGEATTAPIQRAELLEEDDELQLKATAPIQRQGDLDEEELLQGKFATNVTPMQLQNRDKPAENRTGMPEHLKAGLERLSGFDLSGVRVHRNSAKPAQLNALAYTQGQNIEVGPGQERHLPHEGWHVVQQMQGRVQPTMQAQGVVINDDAGLEREADVMGARAFQMRVLPAAAPIVEHRSRPRPAAVVPDGEVIQGFGLWLAGVLEKWFHWGKPRDDFEADKHAATLPQKMVVRDIVELDGWQAFNGGHVVVDDLDGDVYDRWLHIAGAKQRGLGLLNFSLTSSHYDIANTPQFEVQLPNQWFGRNWGTVLFGKITGPNSRQMWFQIEAHSGTLSQDSDYIRFLTDVVMHGADFLYHSKLLMAKTGILSHTNVGPRGTDPATEKPPNSSARSVGGI